MKKNRKKNFRKTLAVRVIFAGTVLFLCGYLSFCAFTGKAASLRLPAIVIAASAASSFLIQRGVRRGWRAALFSAALGTGILFLSIMPASVFREPLYGVVYRAESFFTGGQDAGRFHPSGEINRGNLYPSEETIAVVYADQMPSESLYLKNFTGGDYEDGVWGTNEAQEDEIMDHVISRHSRWYTWSRSVFENLYLTANTGINFFSDGENSHQLMITGSRLRNDDIPIPYYGRVIYRTNRNSSTSDSSVFRYLERNQIVQPLDEKTDSFNTGIGYDNEDGYSTADWFLPWAEDLEKRYRKQLFRYTDVDAASLPTLASYVAEHPANSQEEAIQMVLSLLSEQEYSLTPGHVPYGEDPSEYFVHDSHLGYCQQFASTAVLMLRMYGVPARYAAGYRLDPMDFEEDGSTPGMSVSAELSEESAHAWVEIFVRDHGWIPLEVTPDAEGTIRTEIPGLDGESLFASSLNLAQASAGEDGIYRLPTMDFGNRNSRGETEENSGAESDISETGNGDGASFGSGSVFLRALWNVEKISAGAVLFLLFLSPALVRIAKKVRRERIGRMEEEKLALLIMKRLRKKGLPESYTGQEADFPERAARAIENRRGGVIRSQRDRAAGSRGNEVKGNPRGSHAEQISPMYTQDAAKRLQRILLMLSFGENQNFRLPNESVDFLRALLEKV